MGFVSKPPLAKLSTRRRTSQWTILALVSLALWLSPHTGRAYTALYVFGDSLSDTGRNPAPAGQYYEGRYCNGPVWVEYLSADLGIPYNPSNNFAFAGSTTTNLLSQIANLKAFTNLQTALFTLKSGGNDFIANTSTGLTSSATWGVVITNIVDNLTNAIGALYTNGARNIIVANLPNLAQAPAFIAADSEAYSNLVVSKVSFFNNLYASALTNEMQHYSGLRLYLMDDYDALNYTITNASALGFTVTSVGALEDPNLTDKSFTGPGANYVFWDELHPTTKVDELTASTAFAAVAVQLALARSGTNFNLSVNHLYPTFPYTIETSTNLTTWSTYQAITATTTNANLTLTNRFVKAGTYYRANY